MKLSKFQKEVLLAMKNGRELHFMRGFEARAFLHSSMKTVPLPTFCILRDGRFLVLVSKNWCSSVYKISPQGKNAIKNET